LALSRAQELAQQAVALAAEPLERSVALEALGDTFNHGYAGDLAWQYLRDAVDARVEATPEDRLAIVGLCARALEVPTSWPGSLRARPAPRLSPRHRGPLGGRGHLRDGRVEPLPHRALPGGRAVRRRGVPAHGRHDAGRRPAQRGVEGAGALPARRLGRLHG